MYHYRLIISYKGSQYYGWQDLGSKKEKPTIETSIHQVLKKPKEEKLSPKAKAQGLHLMHISYD